MIAFDSVSRDEMEAMCTPMHRILSPTPLPAPVPVPVPAYNKNTLLNDNKNSKSANSTGSTSTSAVSADQDPAARTGALYLGSMAAVHDLDLLREHGITHLVQVLEVPWIPQADDDGFTYHRIDIEDRSSAALKPHLDAACNYIRASLARGDNVLVHCQQGVSRSASIVIAYLIRDRSMTYDDAFDLVKQRRQCIKPNSGFIKALREWEIACKIPPRPASR
jgi:protein-tyrosine phosphatase